MTPKSSAIPAPAVRRLSLYLRHLEALDAKGSRTVSSRQLGEALGLTDAQVRKDLAYFGQFGYPGIGYRVGELIVQTRHILGTDKTWNTLLVGAGNLGRALVSYRGFARKGFDVVAVFDIDRKKIGRPLLPDGSLRVRPIQDMRAIVADMRIRLGILAVPVDAAQAVAEQMIHAGVRGIMNFAPTSLQVPSTVAVTGIDLAVNLEQLSFQLGGSLD